MNKTDISKTPDKPEPSFVGGFTLNGAAAPVLGPYIWYPTNGGNYQTPAVDFTAAAGTCSILTLSVQGGSV